MLQIEKRLDICGIQLRKAPENAHPTSGVRETMSLGKQPSNLEIRRAPTKRLFQFADARRQLSRPIPERNDSLSSFALDFTPSSCELENDPPFSNSLGKSRCTF